MTSFIFNVRGKFWLKIFNEQPPWAQAAPVFRDTGRRNFRPHRSYHHSI